MRSRALGGEVLTQLGRFSHMVFCRDSVQDNMVECRGMSEKRSVFQEGMNGQALK